MEQNVEAIAKRACQAVRLAFYILRKNISKRKLLLDLKYFTMKRPKLAGSLGGGAYEQKGESEMHAVERVLESMTVEQNDVVEGSPYPYFYSPYPIMHDEEETDRGQVDEAAEMFIQRFYAQLRQQRIMDA